MKIKQGEELQIKKWYIGTRSIPSPYKNNYDRRIMIYCFYLKELPKDIGVSFRALKHLGFWLEFDIRIKLPIFRIHFY